MALNTDIGRINEPILRDLAKKLADDADARMVDLARGGATDFAAYQKRVGYLEAIGTFLGMCVELDQERYGARSDNQQE